tara:strand:- start:873 stop:1115 length:243 start_codon:yes stop_codon:yes gene_type:complete
MSVPKWAIAPTGWKIRRKPLQTAVVMDDHGLQKLAMMATTSPVTVAIPPAKSRQVGDVHGRHPVYANGFHRNRYRQEMMI